VKAKPRSATAVEIRRPRPWTPRLRARFCSTTSRRRSGRNRRVRDWRRRSRRATTEHASVPHAGRDGPLAQERIWKHPTTPPASSMCTARMDPGVLRFTVDGAVVREERNTIGTNRWRSALDSETFAGWFGLPTDDALPAHVQPRLRPTWKRKDGPADDRPEAVEFSFPGRPALGNRVRLKAEGGGTLRCRQRAEPNGPNGFTWTRERRVLRSQKERRFRRP